MADYTFIVSSSAQVGSDFLTKSLLSLFTTLKLVFSVTYSNCYKEIISFYP